MYIFEKKVDKTVDRQQKRKSGEMMVHENSRVVAPGQESMGKLNNNVNRDIVKSSVLVKIFKFEDVSGVDAGDLVPPTYAVTRSLPEVKVGARDMVGGVYRFAVHVDGLLVVIIRDSELFF